MKRDQFRLASAAIAAGLCLVAWSGPTAAAAEAHKPFEPPKGLVLYLGFDQAGPAGNVPDRSGRGNNGHLSGAKWMPAGKLGGGCEFEATASCVQVPNRDSLKLKQATFAAWFRTSKSDPVWRRILDKRADRGFALGIGGDLKDPSSRGKLGFMVNGCPPCLSDRIVIDGNWHHVAATYDGENLRLYVDGTMQKEVVPLHGEIAANGDDLTIGMNRANPSAQEKDHAFDGAIDEVMIFDRALSAEEVKGMVLAMDPTAGKPKFTKKQVASRLKQLKSLYDQGLLTKEFYDRKVAECEAAE